MIKTLLVGIAIATAPAAMASTDLQPTKSVSYADLNLMSPEGVATLKQRVSRAADEVCGNANIRDLRATMAAAKCRRLALGNTERAVELAIASQNTQQIASQSTLRRALTAN